MRNIVCACARKCSHAAEGSVVAAVYAAAYLPMPVEQPSVSWHSTALPHESSAFPLHAPTPAISTKVNLKWPYGQYTMAA